MMQCLIVCENIFHSHMSSVCCSCTGRNGEGFNCLWGSELGEVGAEDSLFSALKVNISPCIETNCHLYTKIERFS